MEITPTAKLHRLRPVPPFQGRDTAVECDYTCVCGQRNRVRLRALVPAHPCLNEACRLRVREIVALPQPPEEAFLVVFEHVDTGETLEVRLPASAS